MTELKGDPFFMVLQLFVFHKKAELGRLLAFFTLTLLSLVSCDMKRPVPLTTAGSGSSPTSSTSASRDAFTPYKNASTAKVIFNKKGFYTNFNTNSFGCAGDAKAYFDPQKDREVPVKPDWVKNVAVEITNSNAAKGPSLAASCGLSGLGSPTAANCAVFDDLQPLDGTSSRTVLIGGYGCQSHSSTCSTSYALSDIWNIYVPDLATGSTWGRQPVGMPAITSSTASPGAVWAGGDYDELHNMFYVFGGVTPSTSSASGVLDFTSAMTRISFSSEGTVDTSSVPANITANQSTVLGYANWAKSTFTGAPFFRPPPMVGHSFTYGLRRDPTMKTWCNSSDSNTTLCPSSATTTAVARNEHHDYFLLTGGLINANPDGAGSLIAGSFLDRIYVYKPHGFSIDVGTNSPIGGDWVQMSNVSGVAGMSSSVMRVVSIAATNNSTEPFSVSTATWSGRGYHRTVYDPSMNRFYIFGGLTNTSSASALTGGTAPTTVSELWVYDPPNLARRPTAACFSTTTPDGITIPIGAGGSGSDVASILVDTTAAPALGAMSGLGINRRYMSSQMVFPPGGCLQRVTPVDAGTTPSARFEHAMAFDRDQKAMLVFGGCTQTSTIADSGTTGAGDPNANCASGAALLNDTWFYLPPVTTEVVSRSYTTATYPHPYGSPVYPNIFGTDFWIHQFPIHTANSPGNATITLPSNDQVLGSWIRLSPSTTPTRRVSASIAYDRAHHKFYLQGGYGCLTSSCTEFRYLNDLWEFSPPNVNGCSRTAATCSSTGEWRQIRSNDPVNDTQPTTRKSALMAYAQPMFSYGDDYYTALDTPCVNQGPIATNDMSISKQNVGAIYVDLDRDKFSTNENLLINLRMLPFDARTRLPGWSDNISPYTTFDDIDSSSPSDVATIRVRVLGNPIRYGDQIQSLIQPRYHEFLSGTSIIIDNLLYVGGPTGQVTERQVLVPLPVDSSANLIKIERVQGSVKFYEMTLSKF